MDFPTQDEISQGMEVLSLFYLRNMSSFQNYVHDE